MSAPKHPDAPHAPRRTNAHPVMSVRGLEIAFGSRIVTSGVDLDLVPGRILAIVGPSGAGKSVTARALVGLAGSGARTRADRLDVVDVVDVVDAARPHGSPDHRYGKHPQHTPGNTLFPSPCDASAAGKSPAEPLEAPDTTRPHSSPKHRYGKHPQNTPGNTLFPSPCDASAAEASSDSVVYAEADSSATQGATQRATQGVTTPTATTTAAPAERIDLRAGHERDWLRVRGRLVGLVLQDALVALDPLRTVGRELDEAMGRLPGVSRADRRARAAALLERAGLADPESFLDRRADELSGGQRQRALIATAIARDPAILIADEPTASLDPATRDDVLALLRALADDGVAVLLVSHDLAGVAKVADEVRELHEGGLRPAKGRGRDTPASAPASAPGPAPAHAPAPAPSPAPARAPGPAPAHASAAAAAAATTRTPTQLHEHEHEQEQEQEPQHRRDPQQEHEPVQALEQAEAREREPMREREQQHPDASRPLVEIRHLSKAFRGANGERIDAVVDADLDLHEGETVGLVGASGSGKTTLGRLLLGLQEPDSGTIELGGVRWSPASQAQRRLMRGRVGHVPQDALSSFDPRRTVGAILADAITGGASRSVRRNRAAIETALDEVRLPRDVARRRPLHLSGGQRQRVAIARALAAGPQILVCDEAVSALDPATQDDVLSLLERLRDERGLTMLFISHDPQVTARISHRILRMTEGRLERDETSAPRLVEAPGPRGDEEPTEQALTENRVSGNQ